ncbi:alpha-(1,3)-fucosyltransferase C-like [Tachypleus tridentatus]|uniref:alpha-(1,3)-fucosyltransferase C-like n=1 Tax=Tachypleus tridentatus TaxID=6853 RepID=UPI003FD2AF28
MKLPRIFDKARIFLLFLTIVIILASFLSFSIHIDFHIRPSNFHFRQSGDLVQSSKDPGSTGEPYGESGAAVKTVLLWTTFFSEKDYLPSTDKMQCTERRCSLTSNRRVLNQSDALVFHWADYLFNDIPAIRLSHQRWILFVLESPHNTGSLDHFNDMINWTATFRLDSDIVTPYGHVQKTTNRSVTLEPVSRDHASNKTKMVVWFVSNCKTVGNREGYVSELKQYVPVDVYGLCGEKSCQPRMSKVCYNDVAREYRFYLSFENSICQDYVTEKFFHILQTDMVPVVFGGGNYSELAPPKSFINALEFATPKDLADYLIYLSQNTTEYNSYFRWKQMHAMGGYHWVCELCRKLHDSTEGPSTYQEIDKWWKTQASCKSWSKAQGLLSV